MPPPIPDPITALPTATSLSAKLANVLACPGDVFEEVAATPPRLLNWIIPTLLVAVTSIVLALVLNPEGKVAAIGQLIDASTTDRAAARLQVAAARLQVLVAVPFAAFAATAWSALVLWFIGRIFLNAPFSYRKALEVVGLTGSIAALGAVVTGLLVAVSQDVSARPALSWFAESLPAANPLRAGLDVLNVFHLWTTAVLAVGLSKLSAVSIKESAFWVFGYWLVFRICLLVLA